MFKKISIILFFAAIVGARHAVPLQGLSLLSGLAIAQTTQTECPPECVTDTLEIISYYPSPYGYYEELRGDKIIVGDTDNSHIDETHLPPSGTITFEPKSYAQITTEGTLYEGTVYYDSFDHEFKYYDNNSSWQPLGGGGGDYWKPSEASGRSSSDIYYNWPGNVGIGVGSGDTIGAKLQINDVSNEKVFIIKKTIDTYETRTFTYTNTVQTYRVPSGVSSLKISAYGAQGGNSNDCGAVYVGGLGGRSEDTISVTSGETLYIYVGGQNGYNGDTVKSGGNAGTQTTPPWCSSAGTGGGASDIRRGGYSLSNRIIVAGGGGGAGATASGGTGGGTSGNNGSNSTCGCISGGGGTSGSGGTGGTGGDNGNSGSLGTGGTGGNGGSSHADGKAGGGGGGGYYGGGGGGGGTYCGPGLYGGAGGGGGSSLFSSGGTTQAGVNSGNGKVIIEPIFSGSVGSFTEWQNSGGEAISVMDGIGNLALGASSANGYKLYVNGSAYVTSGAWTASDLRFKENILPLNNSLDKILNIQPVSFDWNKSGYPDMNFDPSRQIGLVAQEVEKQIPELVHTDINGYKAVAYDKLTAVLVEAVKEQQAQMRNQQKKIEILELKLEELDNKK